MEKGVMTTGQIEHHIGILMQKYRKVLQKGPEYNHLLNDHILKDVVIMAPSHLANVSFGENCYQITEEMIETKLCRAFGIKPLEIKPLVKLDIFPLRGNISNETYHGHGVVVGANFETYNIFDMNTVERYVTVENVAASLSKMCRYVGNTHGFYSVAQHSVRMAETFISLGNITAAIQSLFHDASESLISDFNRPVKRYFETQTPIYKELEEKMTITIFKKLDILYPILDCVDVVDKNQSAWELEFMFINKDHFTDYWLPEKAEHMFIQTYNQIKVLLNYYSPS